MTTPVIIDLSVAAVLLGFAVFGARRGLLRSVAGLVIVVLALVGAGMIAATFTEPLTKLTAPLIREHFETRVDEAMAAESDKAQMPEADMEGGFDAESLLALLGLDAAVREDLAERAGEAIRETGVTLAMAVAESLARSVIYGGLYILSFLALLVLLHVLMRAMDLVLKLPGLHLLNTLGGGAAGLIEGALLLFLAVWVLRHLGVSFETGPAAEAHILSVFTTNTPLSVLSFLQ